VNVRRVNGE